MVHRAVRFLDIAYLRIVDNNHVTSMVEMIGMTKQRQQRKEYQRDARPRSILRLSRTCERPHPSACTL